MNCDTFFFAETTMISTQCALDYIDKIKLNQNELIVGSTTYFQIRFNLKVQASIQKQNGMQ